MTYGFTDTVVKEGGVFYTTVLYYEACLTLVGAFRSAGPSWAPAAADFAARAKLIKANIHDAFWSESAHSFLSSTGPYEHRLPDGVCAPCLPALATSRPRHPWDECARPCTC